MSIEISSSDPDTIKRLQAIADAEPQNVLSLPISPMEGKEILSLAIENYATLSAGTVALIVALKNKIDYLKITKNGLELRGAAKEAALSGSK
jgi:hypothetical protein